MQELDEWMNERTANQKLFERLIEPNRFEKETTIRYETGVDDLRRKIESNLYGGIVRKMRAKTVAWYIAGTAAAIIAIIVSIYYPGEPAWTKQTVSEPTLMLPGSKDIPLGKGLNLTNDQKRRFDYDDSRMGALSYHPNNSQGRTNKYHTVQIPVKYKFCLNLEDSTEVWMNGPTSIHYAELFEKSDRYVEMRGEAFFKITPSQKRPFIIEFSRGEMRAYEAKVYAYDRDDVVFIAVISGVAKINGNANQVEVRAGHIGIIGKKGNLDTQPVDTNLYVRTKDSIPLFPMESLIDSAAKNGWNEGYKKGAKIIKQPNSP
jgi:hypothetical protein